MISVAVVCEADADRRTGCGLADRVLLEAIKWLEAGHLDSLRAYHGLRVEEPFLQWTAVAAHAQKLGWRAGGHFAGEAAEPDAIAARRAILLLQVSEEPPDGIILLRDLDGDKRRQKGIELARTEA